MGIIDLFSILGFQSMNILCPSIFKISLDFFCVLQFSAYKFCKSYVTFACKHICLSNCKWLCIFKFSVHIFAESVGWFCMVNLLVLGGVYYCFFNITWDFLSRRSHHPQRGPVYFARKFLIYLCDFFFNSLLICILCCLICFQIWNQSFTSGISPTSLWYIVLPIYCWNLFVIVLLRIFAPIFMGNVGP